MRALALAVALALAGGQALAQYGDGATSAWFKSLKSGFTQNCCDQADCRRTESEYRSEYGIDAAGQRVPSEGAWWALSKRTGKWVRIDKSQVTSTVSIFADAVLCEGDPQEFVEDQNGEAHYVGEPMARVYCFAPPPIGQ
jgi:hypothetical protein